MCDRAELPSKQVSNLPKQYEPSVVCYDTNKEENHLGETNNNYHERPYVTEFAIPCTSPNTCVQCNTEHNETRIFCKWFLILLFV